MPKFPKGSGHQVTVNLVGTVLAGSTACLVSDMIKRPFRAHTWRIAFPLNQNRTVKHYLYVSPDADTSSVLPLTGFDVLLENSSYNYVVGDSEEKIIHHDVFFETGVGFIKVFCDNTDVFDHDIDVQCFCEIY